jgi:dienelactone hydrolase
VWNDAAPDRAHGPYPLVVFAPGYGVDWSFYGALLARIAGAGYVVVSPQYPLLSGVPAGPSDQVGWDDTFVDTQFVTTSMLNLNASGDPIVGGLIDGRRIGVMGHSDGAAIAFGDGFSIGRVDPRVGAVVSFAAMLGGMAGDYQPNGRPFLHFLDDQDEYNPFGPALDWDHANLAPPSWTVALWNASHAPPYTDPGDPHFELVVDTTIHFLDGTLKADPVALLLMAWGVQGRPDLAAFQ